jgi:plasmid maintenance system antidote protein VapI
MQSGPQQLREWMGRRVYNMTETADFLGLKLPFVSLLLSGKRTPSRETAVKIERLTGVPVQAWSLRSRVSTKKPKASVVLKQAV